MLEVRAVPCRVLAGQGINVDLTARHAYRAWEVSFSCRSSL